MLDKDFILQYSDLKNQRWVGTWEDYTNNNVYLWRRDKNGERRVVEVEGLSRWFYFLSEEKNKIPSTTWQMWKKNGLYTIGRRLGKYSCVYSNLNSKAYFDFINVVDNLGITPLEGDLSRSYRLMIDLGLNIAGPNEENGPKWVYYDIETDDRDVKIQIGKHRILSVATKDGQTGAEKWFYLADESDLAEEKLLADVLAELTKYDVIVGYNNFNFDDQYLSERCGLYDLDLSRWKRIGKFDFFNLLERQHTFAKYGAKDRKLDTISKAVINRGKVPHTETIYALWKNNRALLEEYNLEDVRLIFDLEKILRTVNLALEVNSISGLAYNYGYSVYRAIDNLTLRAANTNRLAGIGDFRFPSGYYRPEHSIGNNNKNAMAGDKRKDRASLLKENYDIDYEPVHGALVLEVIPGIYENVHVADFNSLYPNTIIAFNIGLDTQITDQAIPHCTAPNGIMFRYDVESYQAQNCRLLLERRKATRQEMKAEQNKIVYNSLDVRQNALKELANSTYGVNALWGCRYYAPQIAEAITSGGKYFLPFAVEYFEAKGDEFKVVAGDTDSFFVQMPKRADPEQEVTAYLELLRADLKRKFNCQNPDVLRMSVEKGMSRLLMVAKKMYAAHLTVIDGVKADKLLYKGLRLVKGNNSKWTSARMKELMETVLRKDYPSEYYENFIERCKSELIAGNIDWRQLIISARLGKSPDEYASILPHVTIAKRLIESGEHVPAYTTINYIVSGVENKKLAGLAESEVVVGESVYDATYYFNNEFLMQASEYLGIIFPEVDWWEKFAFPKNLKRNPFECKVIIK